jgi:hypothetical protein
MSKKQRKRTLFLNASCNALLLINRLAPNTYTVGIIRIVYARIVIYSGNCYSFASRA